MTDRLLVVGGTFDPPHNGHLAIAEQVRDALIGEVCLMVANQPALRPEPVASAAARWEMVVAATQHRRIEASDLEIRRGGETYTVDTWRELSALHPDSEIWFALGVDAARRIQQWKEASTLADEANFVIVNRSGVPRMDVAEARRLGFSPERTRLLSVFSPAISATEIRSRVARGQSIQAQVSPSVAAIINRDQLYNVGG